MKRTGRYEIMCYDRNMKVLQCLLFLVIFGMCRSEVSKCSRGDIDMTILTVANELIATANNLLPKNGFAEIDLKTWRCETKEKSSSYLDAANFLISKSKKCTPRFEKLRERGAKEESTTDKIINALTSQCQRSQDKPKDCTDILLSGTKRSGVYPIWPRNRISKQKSINVYCDMDTDGGGWTVIQRRGKFSTPKDYFYKDWESYKKGFGDLTEEFWIGNDNIYALSNQNQNVLRLDLKDGNGSTAYAEYYTFWIENEKRNYTLHVDHYDGTAGDCMIISDNRKFSTKDRDNDIHKSGSCAEEWKGAWWYKDCAYANPNGLNQPGVDDQKGMYWSSWRKGTVSLAGIEMKLRPR